MKTASKECKHLFLSLFLCLIKRLMTFCGVNICFFHCFYAVSIIKVMQENIKECLSYKEMNEYKEFTKTTFILKKFNNGNCRQRV